MLQDILTDFEPTTENVKMVKKFIKEFEFRSYYLSKEIKYLNNICDSLKHKIEQARRGIYYIAQSTAKSIEIYDYCKDILIKHFESQLEKTISDINDITIVKNSFDNHVSLFKSIIPQELDQHNNDDTAKQPTTPKG